MCLSQLQLLQMTALVEPNGHRLARFLLKNLDHTVAVSICSPGIAVNDCMFQLGSDTTT